MSLKTHVLLFCIVAGCASCSLIAGEPSLQNEPGAPQLRIEYTETLRNQASLRGESFSDIARSAPTVTVTLQQPNSVSADRFRVYVTDRSAPPRVVVFDRGDRTATVLPTPAPPAAGTLLDPSGIAVDASDLIYVADAQQGRVFGYDRNGALLFTLGKTGELAYPTDIAIDKQRNRIYVADAHAHAVQIYTTLGERITEIRGGPGKEFRYPVSVALGGSGVLYVLDSMRKAVFLFDPAGTFVQAFGVGGGERGGAIKLRGIAVDSDGHVYVADSVANNIRIYDRAGKFLEDWGRTGIMRGDFWTPMGLFIDDRDTIYIADQTNGRIQVYQYLK